MREDKNTKTGIIVTKATGYRRTVQYEKETAKCYYIRTSFTTCPPAKYLKDTRYEKFYGENELSQVPEAENEHN